MMYVYRKSYYSSITSLYKWWARIAKSGKQSMLMLFSASIVSSAVPLPLFLLLLWWMWPFHYCCIYIILPIYIVTLVLSAIGVGWEKAMPSAQQGTMTVGTYLPILYQPSYPIIVCNSNSSNRHNKRYTPDDLRLTRLTQLVVRKKNNKRFIRSILRDPQRRNDFFLGVVGVVVRRRSRQCPILYRTQYSRHTNLHATFVFLQ